MNEGRERPFVSVKFTPVGRTYRFLLPDLALDAEAGAGEVRSATAKPPMVFRPGDAVVVNTAEGPAVGTVLRAIPSLAERKPLQPTPIASSARRRERTSSPA